jgi:hypothetical protein
MAGRSSVVLLPYRGLRGAGRAVRICMRCAGRAEAPEPRNTRNLSEAKRCPDWPLWEQARIPSSPYSLYPIISFLHCLVSIPQP